MKFLPVRSDTLPHALSLACGLAAIGLAGCGGDDAPVVPPPAPAPALVANADTFTLAVGGSGDVLANDTIGGVAASATTVSVSAVSTLPAGITLSDAGLVTVGPTAAGSSATIGYRICQRALPSNCANGSATVNALGTATLSGRVIDSATALPLAGVRVEVDGRSTTTDATGGYLLQNLGTNARLPVRFTLTDYAGTTRIGAVAANSGTELQARLVRVATRATIAIDTGGTALVADSPATVTIAAASLQRADGSVPTGNVVVLATPVDPAVDTAQTPGDFTTLDAGTVRPVESFGVLDVTIVDNANQSLALRAGQSATIRIPLASRHANPPASVPLMRLDTATGRWVQDGTATLGGSGTARYYEGSIGRIATWQAGRIYEAVNVFGCVADAAGNRIAGATVTSDGIDWSGTTTATSDASGNVTLPLKAGSTAAVSALSNGRVTNTLRLETQTFDRTMPNCLALGQPGAGVAMKLTWGTTPVDLDAHLYTPSGDHLFFGNKGALASAPFASVDVDDVAAFGPEVITISRLMVGTYRYSVQNFSGSASGSFRDSRARVELNLPGRAPELFTPPTGANAGNWWNLFEFDVDTRCNITVRRIGALASAPPGGLALPGTVPSYCTP